MNIIDVAKICHEANRAYCEVLGDFSQVPWDAAPDWQQKSATKGVVFCLHNPNAPASANHDAWLEQKKQDGWRWGAVKNAEAKEHPCFVPYEELPEEQKAKDHLFKAIVEAFRPFIPVLREEN